MSSIASTTPVDRLLQKCTGKRAYIPNLFSLCPGWQLSPNSNYGRSVEGFLDSRRQE
jgi:hypothetical protein